MKIIKLSQKQLDKLERYDIPKDVSNTEGTIYKLKTGIKKIDNEDLLLKKLFITQDRLIQDEEDGYIYTKNFSNKLNTISQLNDLSQVFDLEGLVIPQHQVDVRGEIVGFTVPEIKEARSLQTILRDYNTPIEEKIDYLKQVGNLLRRIQTLNKYDINFFIHDLHEGNIVVDKNNKIHAIDLDRASFSKDIALPSKYLSSNKKIRKYDTYKFDKIGVPYPSNDADIYCYSVMILNTIYNGDIINLSQEEFYEYLSYLVSIGIKFEFVSLLSQIYHDGKNINPVDYLETLSNKQICQANKKVYQYVKNKK